MIQSAQLVPVLLQDKAGSWYANQTSECNQKTLWLKTVFVSRWYNHAVLLYLNTRHSICTQLQGQRRKNNKRPPAQFLLGCLNSMTMLILMIDQLDLVPLTTAWTSSLPTVCPKPARIRVNTTSSLSPSPPIDRRSMHCPLYFLYHILVILVILIFLCSWKMPYMSASLVGGQPGTYTSTGTILSHPLTTL